MAIVTLGHCLICFIKCDAENICASDTTSNHSRTRNVEVCKRFCILVSRHLNLDLDIQAEKTLNLESDMDTTHVCDDCNPVLESFCRTYDNWQKLQLEMRWMEEKIAKLIQKADDDFNEGNLRYRQEMEEQLRSVGSNMRDVDNFRAKFIKKGNAYNWYFDMKLHK